MATERQRQKILPHQKEKFTFLLAALTSASQCILILHHKFDSMIPNATTMSTSITKVDPIWNTSLTHNRILFYATTIQFNLIKPLDARTLFTSSLVFSVFTVRALKLKSLYCMYSDDEKFNQLNLYIKILSLFFFTLKIFLFYIFSLEMLTKN